MADCLDDFVNTEIKRTFNLVSCSYATGLALEYSKKNSFKIDKLVLAGSMQDIPEEEWSNVLMLMSSCLNDPKKFSKNFLNLITSNSSFIPKQKIIKRAAERKAEKYTEDQFKCFIYNSIRLMSYKAINLDKITCPTLCFTGELDPYVTPKRCKSLADSIPNSNFELIPNSDHLFHIEKPSETIELISDYLLGRQRIAA